MQTRLLFLSMLTGSQYISQFFIRKNIDTIFTYSGGANLHLLDELSKNKFNLIINRHEQFVGHSAEGYARVKKNIGVAITTSGPGLTNMITPLQDAYSDKIPLFCISGQVAQKNLNTRAFQEVNAVALTKPCTQWNFLVRTAHELPWALDSAFQNCKNGPVHLDICSNVFSDTIFQSECLVESIADKINRANKPVFIIGKGCQQSSDLINFISSNFEIPMATTLHALGTIDESLPSSLKMLGMHGSVYANKIVQEADLILGIGNRFDDRTIGEPRLFGQNAKNSFGIFHVDNDQMSIHLVQKIINPTLSINMDAKDFLTQLVYFLSPNEDRKKWINRVLFLKNKHPLYIKSNTNDLHCEDVIHRLSKKLIGQKFIATTGVGSHQMKTAQHIVWQSPNSLITSGSLGTMGVGLPFAIGAHYADPEKMIFCIDGDGSMMMSIQELATIAEYNIPIKILLMNDNSLQMVEAWQEIFYNNNIVGTNLQNPDFKHLVRSFGIKSIRCKSKSNLSRTISQILEFNQGPIFCEFVIQKSFCYPFVKPRSSLDEMIVYKHSE
jgi:acetolactate synthase-1/2/3 large subunit